MSGLNGEHFFSIDKSTRCGSQSASNSVGGGGGGGGGQGWISGKIAYVLAQNTHVKSNCLNQLRTISLIVISVQMTASC